MSHILMDAKVENILKQYHLKSNKNKFNKTSLNRTYRSISTYRDYPLCFTFEHLLLF